MSYTVTLDKAADKELSGFSKGEQKALGEAIDSLEEPLSESVKSKSKAMQGINGLYRLTVGNRRIVYAIDHKGKRVRVVMFDGRNDMYDKATKERLKGLDKSFKGSTFQAQLLVAAAGLRSFA